MPCFAFCGAGLFCPALWQLFFESGLKRHKKGGGYKQGEMLSFWIWGKIGD
jgi:hypothetical protein